MADNFDLKKFLKKSKALENLNPSMKAVNENKYYKDAEADDAEHIDALEKDMKDDKKSSMKAKIKEYILAELELDIDDSDKTDAELNSDYDPVYEGDKTPEEKAEEDEALLDGGFGSFEEGYPEEIEYEEDTYDYSNDFYDGDPNDFGDTDEFDGHGGYDIDEAKKKDKVEDVEDVEVTDTEIKDIPAEDEIPTEDTPEATGGIEDIAADMKGTEADLMDHLMKAFQIAKGMQNEKLETQVGNTLKFFVSEYIGGGEQ
jgi:hypothetical protein